jgi:hypothetical protein
MESNVEATDAFLFSPSTVETRHYAYPEAAKAVVGSRMERDDRALWQRVKSDLAGEGVRSISLPRRLVHSTEEDWAYRTVDTTIRALTDRVSLRIDWRDEAEQDGVHPLFLRAMLRGGLQGALYVAESLQND